MGFKEELNKEMDELKKVRRPYETAAFILFAILVLQQLIYLLKYLIDFISKNSGFLSTNGWTNANLMGFIVRIVGLGSSKWIYVILGVLAFVIYYALMYFFVWNYCKKRNLAKWTWTLLVVFGPTIFLIPSYIWFVVYVFRPYLARFAKKMYQEFKDYDPKKPLPEEAEVEKEPVEAK